MYQVKVYTNREIDLLKSSLISKFGSPKFKNSHSGNVADVVNGELIQTDITFTETISIWDKNNIIYYNFYQETDSEKSSTLFVLKKEDRQFMDFIGGALAYPSIV